MSARLEKILDFYLLAKGTVIDEGFGPEIEWQKKLNFSDLDESALLREAAWVVLSAGMRESVIRNKFADLSLAFYNWQSASKIARNARQCKSAALCVFAHPRKISSIIEIAESIYCSGFDAIRSKIASGGILFLQSLPYIGPATSCHLAKNIGLDFVKPDRHLLRISALAGYRDPVEMCNAISSSVGDSPSVVDLIVWRYATLNPGYKNFLTLFLR